MNFQISPSGEMICINDLNFFPSKLPKILAATAQLNPKKNHPENTDTNFPPKIKVKKSSLNKQTDHIKKKHQDSQGK